LIVSNKHVYARKTVNINITAHAINASKDIPIAKMIIYATSAELLATTTHQLKPASVLKKRDIFGITKHA
jgi:hypothetical protein